MHSPSALGIITPEGTPVDAVDAPKQLATNTEEPASVTPLENAVVFIYSLMFRLTKTVSLTCNSSNRMLIITVFKLILSVR